MILTKFIFIQYIRLKNVIDKLVKAIIGHRFDAERDIVLITGGCSGLGKELALVFANEGAEVVVLDINLSEEFTTNNRVHYYQCDVSSRKQVYDSYKLIKAEVGKITILINNAAIASNQSLLELSFDDIERTIEVNLMASFYTIKCFLPDMIRKKRGYIVTIASVLGYMSPARLSAYGVSKSGLIALHELLTYELGPPSFNLTGIKTLLVCPGQLKTGLFEHVTTPSTFLAPELDSCYVAKSVLKAIKLGQRGEIKVPTYGKFIPIFRVFPWPIVEFFRNVFGIDRSISAIKSAVSIVSSVSSLYSRSNLGSRTNSNAGSFPASSVNFQEIMNHRN